MARKGAKQDLAYFKNKMDRALREQKPRAAEEYRMRLLLLEDAMKAEQLMKKRKKA